MRGRQHPDHVLFAEDRPPAAAAGSDAAGRSLIPVPLPPNDAVSVFAIAHNLYCFFFSAPTSHILLRLQTTSPRKRRSAPSTPRRSKAAKALDEPKGLQTPPRGLQTPLRNVQTANSRALQTPPRALLSGGEALPPSPYDVSVELTPVMRSMGQSLMKAAEKPRFASWCMYEFFYSNIDRCGVGTRVPACSFSKPLLTRSFPF